MGFKPLGLGMGKNVKNLKWEWDLRITKWDLKKRELGNGIGTPPSGPSDKTLTPQAIAMNMLSPLPS